MQNDENTFEYKAAEVRFDLVPYTRGRVLDIGCGPDRCFPHFIGIDNGAYATQIGGGPRPDIVADATDLSVIGDESCDSVFSSYLLHELPDTLKALKEWMRVIKKGGYLCLYMPVLPAKAGTLDAIMETVGCTWDLLVNRQSTDGKSFLQVYQKGGPGHRRSFQSPKPAKKALVVRYGGFGDMIQASSVLPGLKKLGFHVTFNTTTLGHNILKHDPHIDEFLVQDTDQVPNEWLGMYWDHMRTRYERVVNLSESVEGSLLSIPNRAPRSWPKAARHLLMNSNYIEMTHAIADVVDAPMQPAFYPSLEEREWAMKERTAMGGKPVILWSLGGSAVHKTWPYMDSVIARLLVTFPDCRIVLTGDALCQALERGWEKEPRVLCRSNVWTIRQSLTFACRQADLVVGPETGVLNAVGHEPVAKVVMLSHSTKENLTKHWVNTVALEPPPSVPCYPCHMLHYSFKDCRRDEVTGTAACQAAIPADVVWGAIVGIMKKTGALERAKAS